jgi:hypothetical protein
VKKSWIVVSVGEVLGPDKRISLGAPTPSKRDQAIPRVWLAVTQTCSPLFRSLF